MRRGMWIGPLHLTTSRVGECARRIEGCGCTVTERDDQTHAILETSHAKGYQIRYRPSEAVVVAVRCRYPGCPLPPGLWLRMKRARLLWMLKGRPVSPPSGVSVDPDAMCCSVTSERA